MAEDAAGTSAALDAAATTTLAPRGAGQARVFRPTPEGQPQAALAAVRAHLAEWPLDALALSTTANTDRADLPLGPGGAGAGPGRPARQPGAAVWRRLVVRRASRHGAVRGRAGRPGAADPGALLRRQPRNGYIAHSIGHLHYETGDHAGAIAFLRGWLPGYPRAGRLHGPPALAPGAERIAVGQRSRGLPPIHRSLRGGGVPRAGPAQADRWRGLPVARRTGRASARPGPLAGRCMPSPRSWRRGRACRWPTGMWC